VVPGQLTCERWRAGCASRFFAGIFCFSCFCRSNRHIPATVSMVRDVWSTAYATECPTGPAATEQLTWDRVATASERQAVTNSLSDATDKARLHAVSSPKNIDNRYPYSLSSPHSSDWLHALLLSGCGLHLDDRAIHIAVGLRLGVNICEPRQYPCGAFVDARGLHGLSCRGGNGRSARHHSLNDLVWRAMAKADIPALKEPSGLLRTDGKRPDSVTLLPWKQGKCVTWDFTVSDTMAQSYVHETSQTPGAAAEAVAERKTNKYASLAQS